MQPQTIGQKRIRVGLNSSPDHREDPIKETSAKLVDLIDELKAPSDDPDEVAEFNRLKEYALYCVEIGCLFGVKAATV